MLVSSTNGDHVGGTGFGLNVGGVLDAPCTVLADGLPTVWGEIWDMNVSDHTLQGGPSVVNWALFNWVSKIIWKYNGFALLCSVISPENSATPSTIRCITHAYHDLVVHVFPTLDGLLVFTLSCQWFFRAHFYWLAFVILQLFWFYNTQLKSALIISFFRIWLNFKSKYLRLERACVDCIFVFQSMIVVVRSLFSKSFLHVIEAS